MSPVRCSRPVTLALRYTGDSGTFSELRATRVSIVDRGQRRVTFVLDQLFTPASANLMGIPAVAETSDGEQWDVWLCDAGLTLATGHLFTPHPFG